MDEQHRKQMIAACQRTLEILYKTPLPTDEESDEIYHALQKALVNVPFTSEKTKSRNRRKAREAARKCNSTT